MACFAFATALGAYLPVLGGLLRFMAAAAVACSRVHTGVHYPGDAVIGSLVGASIGGLIGALARSLAHRTWTTKPDTKPDRAARVIGWER